MTTQATTVRQGKAGLVALVGVTALTLVALGGAATWGLRPGGETATPATASTTVGVDEGALPKGGLAEHHDEVRRATAEGVTPRGGLAGLFAEQAAEARAPRTAVPMAAPARGGMAELHAEQAASRTAAPVIAIGTAAAQVTLPSDLVGLTDGRVVVVVVPTTPDADATPRRATDGSCTDGGAAAPTLVRLSCA